MMRLVDFEAPGGGGAPPMSACCVLPGSGYSPVARAAPLPLGSMLVVPDADRTLHALGEAFPHWRISPWCPGVLLSSGPISQALLDAIRPPAMKLAVVEAIELPPVPVVRATIRNRPIPGTTDLAAYLAMQASMRCASLFLSALRADISTAHLRRPLRQLGRWSPHDWQAIDRCVKIVARAIAHRHTEAEEADRADMDFKTLSAWCGRYFGRDWRALVGLEAWEAVLELAVREGGYLRSR